LPPLAVTFLFVYRAQSPKNSETGKNDSANE